ncbi:MAG: HlyD family efflux transporter periplasmic adaptor subunit, partial [Rickettsiales bacterium]|nr:HlyD family efflux transporter periplasmic adaptor subunit [Rickettsiales bacterium]
ALAGAIAVSREKYAVADWLENIEHAPTAAKRVQEAARSEQLCQNYLAARKRFFRYSFAQTIIFLVIYILASVSLLGLGGMLVIRGQLTLGQLVAAELILSVILYGLSKLGYFLVLYYELCAAALKLNALLTDDQPDEEPAPETSSAPAAWQGIRITSALRLVMRLTQAGLVLATLALVFIPWVQTAYGTGAITALDPGGQLQSIHALVKGRIKQWYVRDGSLVKHGDPILEIIDNDPLLLERLEAEAEAARKGREAAHAAAQTSILDLRRKEELFAQGLVSRRDMEQAKIEYSSWQAKEAESVAKLTLVETKLSRQQTQMVLAPKDGLIVRTAAGDLATMVKEGDVLATFVPTDSKRAVELYVSGLDMPLIHQGREVRLQFEGWPVVQFSGWPSAAIGTFAGEVMVIAPSVSPNGKFRILVTEPEGQPWPDTRYLRFGARANGWVLLDTVPLGYELWRQMNGFPPENADLKKAQAALISAHSEEKE